ncbi:MAG: hypothetical protein ACD_11C00029G0043 [uncultured bacterium]|nr:MAG: hypothetical protein ACD_11C00029G0043 [uncultured bacterium]HBR72081.1 hypothetical protein [Candidatus Moranbacteria bacterium]
MTDENLNMFNRKTIYGILFGLLAAGLILAGIIFYSKSQKLKVVFLNVGQGDAILISQGSNQILIDGGKSGQILLEKLGKYISFWDRKIETIVITHPDQDHIGGFADVFKSYKIETVVKTNAASSSKTFEFLSNDINSEGSEIVEAKKGVRISFPNGAEMDLIFPSSSVSENEKDTNSQSVVSVLKIGNYKFLFTGDLTAEKEEEISQKGFDISADVLKVAHHGSKYSTGEEFLKKVSPQEAIISVGKNSYGHPAEETLEKLRSIGTKILRTDETGDIIYKCRLPNEECQRK